MVAAVAAAGLDHVRVERPLDQKPGVGEVAGHLLEHPDEGLADDLPFGLGIGDAFKPFQEPVGQL